MAIKLSAASVRAGSLLLGLLLGLLFLPVLLQAGEERSGQAAGWTIDCPDCPKLFSNMTDRSLRLDAAGHPHVVYGQDHLYYAWHDGAAWHYETADASPGVGIYASLALDGDDSPHVSYFDVDQHTLKYAYRDAGAWHTQAVDSAWGWLGYTSLALDNDGRPHIAYAGNGDLKHAWRDDSGWHVETVDVGGGGMGVGGWTSLALDQDGCPHVGYHYCSTAVLCDAELRYAYQAEGTGWVTQTVVSAGSSGGHLSLALDGDGQPHISYYSGGPDYNLRYTYHDSLESGGWHFQVVDAEEGMGYDTSLALDPDGHVQISYGSKSGVRHAYQAKGTGWVTQTIDSAGGRSTSLALDQNGTAHISYLSAGLKHAWPAQGGDWQVETVDTAGSVGMFTSLKLDAAGYPHISYWDYYNYALKYAWYAEETGWHAETVDTGGPDGSVGSNSSLALDAAGYPHISYLDGGNADLKYAWQDDSLESSGWYSETVDSGGDVGYYTSLALDGDGYAHISYQDGTKRGLRYAHQDAAGWHFQTVDGSGNTGWYTSLALDGDGYPHISYWAVDPGSLCYAWQDATGWYTETVDISGDNTGGYTSLALDPADHPHISYRFDHDTLKYAYQAEGSGWHTEPVDSAWGRGGMYTSLALDQEGYPHISYHDPYGDDLKYAYRTDSLESGGWHLEVVDGEGWVGQYTSLALDAAGWPHISYWDQTTADLHYATGCFPPDLSSSAKQAGSPHAAPGERLTYTLDVANSGHKPTAFTLADPFPAFTAYVPGSAWVSSGTLTVTAGIGITWTGAVAADAHLTATFAVTVAAAITRPLSIVNIATISGDPAGPHTLLAAVIVNGLRFYLPLIVKDWGQGEPPPITATPRPSPPPTRPRPAPTPTPTPP